jgi:LuxR family maltose regulon positive regulatory protein
MPTHFLSTKFFIPRPRKVLVQREKLFEMLNDGILGKLILVSAPAGYGKTTLISAWLKNQDLPVAWISLDEGDNDFYGFFSYVIEAIHQKCKIRSMPHSDSAPCRTVIPEHAAQ